MCKMKKYFCLFVLVMLASCSSDDSAESNGVLLKKIVQTFEGSDPVTTVYHYNGNKLAYAMTQDDDRKIVYSYEGNFLSDVSYQNLAGIEYVHTQFTYDGSGRLVHLAVFNEGPDTENYNDYTYNADGTISVVTHYWDDFEGGYIVQNQKMFLLNADIVKTETYFPDGMQTTIRTYDDNHNPYSNITGFDKLLDYDVSVHNNISGTITDPDGNLLQQSNTTYTYNGADYPVTSVQTGIGSTRTDEYFYE
jgi:hypothetical protein